MIKPSKFEAKTRLMKGCAAAILAAAAFIAAPDAQAQFYFRPFFNGFNRPIEEPAPYASHQSVVRILARAGYRLVGPLGSHGDQILAMGVDARGNYMRFVIDPYEGQVLHSRPVGRARFAQPRDDVGPGEPADDAGGRARRAPCDPRRRRRAAGREFAAAQKRRAAQQCAASESNCCKAGGPRQRTAASRRVGSGSARADSTNRRSFFRSSGSLRAERSSAGLGRSRTARVAPGRRLETRSNAAGYRSHSKAAGSSHCSGAARPRPRPRSQPRQQKRLFLHSERSAAASCFRAFGHSCAHSAGDGACCASLSSGDPSKGGF